MREILNGQEYILWYLSVIKYLLADASYENISCFCRGSKDPDQSAPL